MRESKFYLGFFKRNLLVFIVSVVLFSAMGFYYQLSRPVSYSVNRVLEVSYEPNTASEKVIISDSAVSLAREKALHKKLGIEDGSNISIIKSSSLTIKIDSVSKSVFLAKENLEKITAFINEKVEISRVGVDIQSKLLTNVYVGLTVGLVVGFIVALFISLIREYFKKY